jgi:hypothetical protein
MKKIFTLLVLIFPIGIFAQTTLTLQNAKVTISSYADKAVTVSGKSEIHLTNTSLVLVNTTIDLVSADSWVYFDNVRPTDVISNYLSSFKVNGVTAVQATNVRVAIYKQGTIIIPHPSSFKPITAYTGLNFTGDSASYSLNTYNSALGLMDNKIRSFKLKKGYMATLATSADGTGYSRIFIADDADLEVPVVSNYLDQKVSFIRAFSWEYASKKGWCGWSASNVQMTNSTWHYDWGTGATTDQYSEYVPMRWGGAATPWTDIKGKTNSTHVIGFNEPDHTDQSNLTLQQMIDMWPEMMRTGMRVGSPSWANPWSGFGGNLFDFIAKCDQLNYRVDYITLHCYWGGKSPQGWYDDLKYIHDVTGRPLWITEWNNGANWTTEWWPDADRTLTTNNAAKQLSDLKGILQVLDTASFVERYSIYDWVQDCRAVILNDGTKDYLTPAGQFYASNNAPMAFTHKHEVIPGFTFGDPSISSTFTTRKITLNITDPNSENFRGYVMERKVDNGSYTVFSNSDVPTLKTCNDTLDFSIGTKIRYRMKSKLLQSNTSAYSSETGWDVTNGNDIQFGTLSYTNVGWNPVLFRNPYSAIPAIILGAPSNANGGVLVTPRVKLVSSSSRFTVQLSPWSYQNTTTLTKEETVPYLIMNTGSYDFGGLKAEAARATVATTWTPITFATPFDTIPVVFANQILSATANATVVRIKNVTKTGFLARIMKETAVTATQPATESVMYVAITPGIGVMTNRKIKVGRTASTAVSPSIYSSISFGDSIANPIFISQLQTCNDDTVTANMRYLSVYAKYANVIKQREKSLGITTATNDGAGWLVIGSTPVIQATENPTANQFSVYPNPVKDILYLRKENNDAIEIAIYNLSGIRLKSVKVINNQIEVGDLNSGCYILKSENKICKFVKL